MDEKLRGAVVAIECLNGPNPPLGVCVDSGTDMDAVYEIVRLRKRIKELEGAAE